MRFLWSEVASLTLEELHAKLSAGAKEAGAVTIRDLVAPSPDASTGLYVVFDGNVCIYVGRARSRAIIERVPAHFDTRPEGWFGTLLEYLARSSNATRQDVVESALKMRLALIFKDSGNGDVSRAETALRHAFQPRLNTPARRKNVLGTLAEVAR
jgi:hypothetical protein